MTPLKAKNAGANKTGGKRLRALACAAAGLLIAAAPVQAGSDDLTTMVVKRFFLAQANERCHLLDGPAATAVSAGYLQARNSYIRAAGSMARLSPYLDQARDLAQRIDCAAPQLAAEVATANAAYRTYVAQLHLDLPGVRAAWNGTRAYEDRADWRLVQYQSNPDADLALGLYGTLGDNRLVVMAKFNDGQTPYSARLLVRDTSVMASGLINHAAYDLSAVAPVGFGDGSAITFLARAHSEVQAVLRPSVTANQAGFTLTGDYVGVSGPVDAVRFDFPTRAYRAIAPLDPREDIVVAFDFPDGTRYARFEVGDFITGLGYVAMPSPYTHATVN